jgi:hypothetical protein
MYIIHFQVINTNFAKKTSFRRYMYVHVWLFLLLSNIVARQKTPVVLGLASLVSFPYPTLEGLVYIEHILGLVSKFWCASQIHTMWLTCDYHVTPCYS